MLRIILALGSLLAITACRAPEAVREVGRSEAPRRSLPHVFFIEHGAEPSFEPMTRRVLSAEDAAVLAARLANEKCERQYRRSPFKPEQYPAILRDGVYHWGQLDVGGHAGFSATVVFYPDGTGPQVEIYFS